MILRDKQGGTRQAVELPLEPIVAEIHALRAEMTARFSEIQAQLKGQTKEYQMVDEVAAMTGRSSYTIRRWIGLGRLTAIRVEGTGPRGRLLIPRDQLTRLVSAGFGTNIPPTATN